MPLSWEDAQKLSVSDSGRAPSEDAYTPITSRELQLIGIVGEDNKDHPAWQSIQALSAIETPDLMDPSWQNRVVASAAEKLGDRHMLQLVRNLPMFDTVKKTAIQDAREWYKLNPQATAEQLAEYSKASLLAQVYDHTLPAEADRDHYRDTSFELLINNGTRQLAGEEGAKDSPVRAARQQAAYRLRNYSPEVKRMAIGYAQQKYTPDSLGLYDKPVDPLQLYPELSGGARVAASTGMVQAVLKDFATLYGQDNMDNAGLFVATAANKLKRRLSFSRLGVDPEINSDLSSRNLVALDPTKGEGFDMVGVLQSEAAMRAATAPALQDPQLKRLLRAGVDKDIYETYANRVRSVYSFYSAQRSDIAEETQSTPLAVQESYSAPFKALLAVGNIADELVGVWNRSTENALKGGVSKQVAQWIMSPDRQSTPAGKARARVVGAGVEGILDVFRAQMKYVALGSAKSQAIDDLRASTDERIPDIFVKDKLDYHASLKSLLNEMPNTLWFKQQEGALDRAGSLMSGRVPKDYNLKQAWLDVGSVVKGLANSTVLQVGAAISENPQVLPVLLLSEWAEDNTLGPGVKFLVNKAQNTVRLGRLSNAVYDLGPMGGVFARRLDKGIQTLRASIDAGDVVNISKRQRAMLERLEAGAAVMQYEYAGITDNKTAKAYLNQRSPSLNRFAKDVAGTWDLLATQDPALFKSIEKWVDLKRDGMITKAKRWWNRYQGKMPSQMNDRIQAMSSLLLEQELGSVPKQVLGRQMPGDSLVARRAKAAEAMAKGEIPDRVRDRLDKVIDAGGGSTPEVPGELDQWSKLSRLAEIDDLRKTGEGGAALDNEFRDLVKELSSAPLVDELDQAGLILLDNLEQVGRGGAMDAVGALLHKVSGGKLFPNRASLNSVQTVARRILDATSVDTAEYLGTRMLDNVRKRRLDQVYRFADAKLRSRIRDLQVEEAMGKEIGLSNELSINKLREERQALAVEMRDALTADLRDTFNFETTLARKYVSDQDINELILDHPTVWGSVSTVATDPAEVSDFAKAQIASLTATKARAESQAKALATVFADKLKKAELRQLGETNPLLTGTFTEELFRARNVGELFQILSAKKEVVKELAMRLNHFLGDAADPKLASNLDPSIDWKAERDLAMTAIDTLAENPGINISPDDANYLKHVLKQMPEAFWERGVRFVASQEGEVRGAAAWFRPIDNVIGVVENQGDAESVLHEMGHFILGSVLTDDTVKMLGRIWETQSTLAPAEATKFRKYIEALTNPDPRKSVRAIRLLMGNGGAADLKPYWDNFTEWFARAYSRSKRKLMAEDPRVSGSMKLVAEDLNRATAAWDNPEAPSIIGDIIRLFEAGGYEGQGATRLAVRRSQDRLTNFGHNMRGVRQRVLQEVDKHIGYRMTPEMKLLFQGPYQMDPSELSELARDVSEFHYTLQDAISATEAAAGMSAEKFEWNPWATMRSADDAVVDAIKADDAAFVERMNQQTKRLVDWRLDRKIKGVQDELEDIANMFQASRASEAGVDLLTLNAMPFWDQVRAAAAMAKTNELNVAIEADRMERLARVVANLTDDQRKVVQYALEKGVPDLDLLVKRAPGLKRFLAKMKQTHAEAEIQNIKDLLREESALQARLLETAHDKGFITDDMYLKMRKAGYSPHLYGMFERPKLLNTKRARDLKLHVSKQTGAVSGDTTAGLDGSEMMFARDLAQWRVRLEAGDGKIYDELFPSLEEAHSYIRKNWGEETLGGLTADGPNYKFESSLGNKGVLARPIGHDADTLDLLTGEVVEVGPGRFAVKQALAPEARLERFAQLNRDLHTHSFLESLRASGLVITRDQADKFGLLRTGKKGFGKWAQNWRPLPQDPNRFGNMADNFVHARLLTEMNNMHGTYEGVRAIFEGVQEMFDQMGYSDFTNLIQSKMLRALGSLDTALAGAVKTTQVIMSPATIAANFTTNFLFSTLAVGPKVFNPSNWPTFFKTAKDIFGTGLRKISRAARTGVHIPDAEYYEAVKQGIVGSSIFNRSSNPYLRKAYVNLSRLTDKLAMEKRYQKLRGLLSEAMVRGDDAARISNIKLELDAVEQGMEFTQRSLTKKMTQWVLGTLGMIQKNELGLPASAVNHALREFYGKIDDFFKLATYRVARQTMSPTKAAWTIRAFMQDYANVTPIVGQLSRTPLIGGLMPSFVHEMARITKNAIRYRPLRFLAITGAATAFNSLSAFTAGVSEERVQAIEDAMSINDPLTRMFKRATSLRFYDSRTGNLTMNVDFGDTLVPLFNFTQGYNGLGRIAEGMSDPRTRSMWDSAVVGGAKFLGNFVGARPLTNGVLSAAYNQDVVTGAPILGPAADRTAWDYTRGFWHIFGKMIIPPQFPGGRHFTDIAESSDAVRDPRTGRPYKQSSIGRNVIRALTNLKVRGGLAASVSEMLGGVDRYDAVDDRDIIQNLMWQALSSEGTTGANAMPLFGIDRDRSKLWARTMGEADPVTRERLRNQLKAMYRDEDSSMVVAGRKYSTSKTRYQEDQWADTQDKKASLAEQFDTLPIRQQAAVLIGMDLTNVNSRTFAEFVEVMSTTDEPKYRWETASDGQALRNAQLDIQNYIKERPEKAEKFQTVLDWLLYAESKALRLQQEQEKKEIERLIRSGL